MDTSTDPRAPQIKHVVESKEIQEKTGLAYLHSSHCLGSGEPSFHRRLPMEAYSSICRESHCGIIAGEIMVSAMGTPDGEGAGSFVLLDEDFKASHTPYILRSPQNISG